ncbi:MAG: FHA domain-containing protein [Gemmataceae bacterium]|nr:FHA domain-containing protein [Gemmataceae bacterium]
MLTDPAAAFLQACGARKPIHLWVERDGKAHELVVQQPFAVLGNSPKADVLLEDSSVSARHVYLQVFGGRLFFFVTDRIRGVLHHGQSVSYGWFARQEALRIGPYRVTLLDDVGVPLPNGRGSDGNGLNNPLSSGSSAHLAMPFVTFDFGQESRIESHWHMRRQLVLVGRSSLCKVRIHTRTVSRVHCSLVLTHEGPWVVDLLGKGGIKVDGQPIRFAKIKNGSVLEVGNYRTWCRYPSAGHAVGHVLNVPSSAGTFQTSPTESTVGRQLAPLPPSAQPLVPFSGPPGALQTDTLQSLLLPLVSQFNQMQSQMYDQFQQSIFRMFQLFSALHNDQLQLMREELERVHNLARELQTLQQQQQLLALENKQLVASSPCLRSDMTLPDNVPHANGRGSDSPLSPSRDPQGGAERMPRDQKTQGASESALHSGSRSNEVAQGIVQNPATPKKELPFPAPNPALAAAGGDHVELHNLLSQRVSKLQQERQGRWQRLMESLFGRSGAEVP